MPKDIAKCLEISLTTYLDGPPHQPINRQTGTKNKKRIKQQTAHNEIP